MKRVLHIKKSLNYDGATIIEYRIAETINKDFVFDWFIFSDGETAYDSRFKSLGSKIYYCKQVMLSLKTKSPAMAFYKFLKKEKYEIVYFDTDYSGRAHLMFLAKLAGCRRIIIHSHNSQTEGGINPILHRFFKALIYISATDYLACSMEAAKWLFPRKALRKTTIVKNGIDVSLFTYNKSFRDKIRRFWNISDEAYVLGHVGRFCEMKNHVKVISVFNEFHSLHPESYLLLIGEGPLKEKIEEDVSYLNLSEFVKFVGVVDDVFAYYSTMDAFILPSFFEGFPLTALEAECSGLFVYLSDNIPESVRLTEKTKRIPLTIKDSKWADCIYYDLSKTINDRLRYADEIKEKGYDIRISAFKIAEILASK